MPQNALNNPLVLPMLGLLIEQPGHQYALLSRLRDRYPFLTVKTGTVYTLVQSLARKGLLHIDEKAEPQRIRLTDDGRAEFRHLVETSLRSSDPTVDPRFMIALAYLGVLTRETAATLLRDRAAELRDRATGLAELLSRTELRELHMIESHFLASRLEHDASWLATLADRIDTGDLDWIH